MFTICGFANSNPITTSTANYFKTSNALVVPVLGNYGNSTIASAGGNNTVTPDAAPTGTTEIIGYTHTSFKGEIKVNTVTGVVNIINAHPAGMYTVTVNAGDGVLKTFNLTVGNANCSQGNFSSDAVGGAPIGGDQNFGDFNNDGNQDVVSVIATDQFSVNFGNGIGGVGASIHTTTTRTSISDLSIGDFNGDGNQDVATTHYATRKVAIFLGDGDGTFTNGQQSISVGTGPQSLSIGDFNEDGKQDIAVANQNWANGGSVSILLGDGLGNFTVSTSVIVGLNSKDVIIADFNGDTHQDLATTNPNDNTVSINLGNGDGTFGVKTDIAVGTNPTSIAIGDFNNDNLQDFATSNYIGNTVSIVLGQGNGTFATDTSVTVGTGPWGVTIADFNGDGNQDIAAANRTTNNVSVRLGNGLGSFSGTTELAVGTDPQSLAIGDFNQDGLQDIITAGFIHFGVGAEINLQGNFENIVAGTTTASTTNATDFGNITINTSTIKTYTIQNTGNEPVIVSSIVSSGTNAADFVIGGVALPATIAAGADKTFILTFTSASLGDKVATVTINNDDCDEETYTFVVKSKSVSTPTVTTTAASLIASTSATLAGDVTVDGGLTITERGIVYATSDATPTIGEGAIKNTNGTGTGVFTESITGLTAGTQYYFNTYAINSLGTSYGTVATFTTTTTPTVTTTAASLIARTSATLAGNVTADGGLTITERGIVYATSDASPTIAEGATKNTNGTGIGEFTESITGLTEGTQYYYNTYAINSLGTSYGIESTFTTTTTPTVTTTAASLVARTSATLAGNVISDGGLTITERGIVYATSDTTPTIAEGATKDTNGDGAGVFTKSITGLSEGTEYYYNTYAINSLGTSYGTAATFTTEALTLGNYSNITIANAGGNSIVTPDAAPTSVTRVTAYTHTSFKGNITVNKTTGVVNITNAYPAGIYTITVNALESVLKTFDLTVGNPLCTNSSSPVTGINVVGNYSTFGNKTGDFNNDGHLDYVTTAEINGQYYRTINIYFGDGVGGFTLNPVNNYHTAIDDYTGNLRDLVVDDFTGDGNLDVAISYNDQSNSSYRVITLFKGDGTGVMTPIYTSFGFPTNSHISHGMPLLKSLDVDNDGDKDLILGSNKSGTPSSSSIVFFRNNGVGSFTYQANNTPKGNIAIGDFNQDGNQDWFADNLLTINGVTTAIAANSEIPGGYLKDGVVGDFNGDGDQDIVCLNGDSKLFFLLGTNIPNDATFGSPTEIVIDASTHAIEVGDLNGDGFQDILSGGLNTVTIHYGNGDGTFGASITHAVTGQVYTIKLADFNEDGYADLLVNGNAILLDRPEMEILSKGAAIVTGSKSPTKSNQTDFEGVVNGTTKGNEFTITTKGTTTLTSIDIIGADAASFSITGIDFSSPVTLVKDGSKKFNIVFNPALYAAGVKKAVIQINYSDAACYPIEFEVQGTALICSPGTLATPTKMAFTSKGHAMSIAKGDFNEDGNQDLGVLFMSDVEADVVSINLGDGNGGFFESTEVPLEAGNDTYLYGNSYNGGGIKIKVGDFNGDGHLDLVIPTYDSKITLLYGDGSGNFPTKKDIPLIFTNNLGQFSKEVTVGEFNGDGIPDFGVEIYSDGKSDITNIVLSNGSASYTVSTLSVYRDEYNPNYDYFSKGMVIEDIDKDGFQDIVANGQSFGTSSNHEITFIKGNGDGTFTHGIKRSLPSSDWFASYSFTLDFNKDGNLDIVASFNENVFIYTGDGAGNFVKTTNVSLYDWGTNMSVGDLNGDDNMDFIIPTMYMLLVWYGDTIGSFGNETLYGYNEEWGRYTDSSIADFNNDGVQDVIVSDNFRGVYIYLGNKGNEINLQGNGTSIVYGDTTPAILDDTDFGTVALDAITQKTYTIQNTSTEELTVSSIVSSGTHAADFVVGGISLPATLAAGTNSTFTLTFRTTTAEEKTATITVNNDVCNKEAYAFDVKGLGSDPLSNREITFGGVLKIYNSESNNLRIEGLKVTDDKTLLKIYNFLGIEIFKTVFVTKISNDIKISNVNEGAYIIELINSNGRIHKKVFLK